LLGAPAPHSITPAVCWWVLSLPAGAAILSSTYLVGFPAIGPAAVGLLQSAALVVAWLIRPRRTARAAVIDPPAGRRPSSPSTYGVQPPAQSPAHIFVCYRRDDSADVTGRIYDRLAARFGREHVFKDVDSIPLGVDFRTHLQQIVGRCDAVVVVIGERWLVMQEQGGTRRLDEPHDFVRIELEAALQRQIPVVPVLVGQAKVPSERDLPQSLVPLAYRQGIAVRPDPDFHRDMDRLIQGLETTVLPHKAQS
jgi:hypothetical protein